MWWHIALISAFGRQAAGSWWVWRQVGLQCKFKYQALHSEILSLKNKTTKQKANEKENPNPETGDPFFFFFQDFHHLFVWGPNQNGWTFLMPLPTWFYSEMEGSMVGRSQDSTCLGQGSRLYMSGIMVGREVGPYKKNFSLPFSGKNQEVGHYFSHLRTCGGGARASIHPACSFSSTGPANSLSLSWHFSFCSWCDVAFSLTLSCLFLVRTHMT